MKADSSSRLSQLKKSFRVGNWYSFMSCYGMATYFSVELFFEYTFSFGPKRLVRLIFGTKQLRSLITNWYYLKTTHMDNSVWANAFRL